MGRALKGRKALFCWLSNCMNYFNQASVQDQPILPLDLFIKDDEFFKNKRAVSMNITDYHTLINTGQVSDFYTQAQQHNIDFVFLLEYHGWAPVPDKLDTAPVRTIVFYYNFDLLDTPNPNVVYYPMWIHFVRDIIPPKDINITTKYPLACASRNFNNGRAGKIYNYQLLKCRPYFEQILFTKFRSIETFEFYSIPTLEQDPEFYSVLDDFLKDYATWTPMNYAELDLYNSMNAIELSVYTDSLFHVVAESRMTESLLSEKTWKIFKVGQIPVMCGPQHSVAHLRRLGFDVFDDIVDHSYDTVADWKGRVQAMHHSLDKIVVLDHDSLLESTRLRRLKNQQHLYSDQLYQTVFGPVVDIIKR